MIEKCLRPKLIDYIFIYLLIFIPNAFILSQFSGTIRMIMYLALIVVLILSNLKKLRVNKKSFFIYLIVLANVSITVLVNNEGSKQLLLSLSLFSVAYIYTTIYDFERFAKAFVKIIYFLSVMSLILYLGALVFPEMVTKLPVAYNVQGKPAYNMFFSTIHINSYLIRNQGIFWEPGAFQTFINLALIFNLFYFKDIKSRNIIIFIVTLFTTFSTTGYIVGFGVIMAFLLSSRKNINDNKVRKINSIMIIITILFMGMAYVYMNIPAAAKYQLFGKLSTYTEYGNGGNMSSTSVRIDAVKTSIKYFLKQPIFGNGSVGMTDIALESGYKMNTATILNWFSMFGIIMGIIMNYGIYKTVNYLQVSTKMKFILYLLFIIALMSEDYVRNPSVLVFVFLGYKNTVQSYIRNI